MNEEVVKNDTQLRRYLIGELNSDEEQKIEERLLVDNDYLEQLLIVEEDLIDDYAAGRLDHSEQKSYEKLFLATNEGRRKLKISQILTKHLKSFNQNREPELTFAEKFRMALAKFLSPPVLTVVAALLFVSLGGLSWWMFFQSNLGLGISALRDAYGQERPLEARITGFPYAKFPGKSNSSQQINTTRLQAADKAFRELAGNDQTPASLHALGKYHLTKKNFDEAISFLEGGLKGAPVNVALRIDLAIAFMERGKLLSSGFQPERASGDFDSSRQHLLEALKLDPLSPEASFNLALLNHIQKSWKAAEMSWRQYLEIDPDSEWAQEARIYLSAAIEAQRK